jgi:hypothetical protein
MMRMRNAEEHKKLLAQIAELEKNSVNYFDVEKEFFLIDSNNLAEIKTRFYGYSIQATGIYEEENLTPKAVANLDGRGCYVYVEVKDGQITIKQDLNGCWGLYLFRHGDYFALSNSFFRLLDHVKFRYPLTVNRDFCYCSMTDILCCNSYSDTAVNEIELLDRSAVVYINISEKNLQTKLINYKEHTVSLDSEEGIATLDRWVEFWGGVFRGLAQSTPFIQADLSGGFDSRVAFVTLLHSGVDLNKVRIYSSTGGLHTHKNDFEVATQIAEHYGFKLNQPLPERQFLNYSIFDSWNIDLYHQQTFRNVSTMSYAKKSVENIYYLKGQTGEAIRDYWHVPPKQFIKNQSWKGNLYSFALSHEIFHSIEKNLLKGFRAVKEKYHIQDEDSPDIPQYMYHDTWSRHHHGKEPCVLFQKGIVSLSPAVDPELLTLKLYTEECPDPNLLIAFIFARYEPELLDFRLVSRHAIAPETIEYAKRLNARFPRHSVTGKVERLETFNLYPRDLKAEKILSEGRNNKDVSERFMLACLIENFDSAKTFGLFTSYFDVSLYNYALSFYENNVFSRFRPIYSVVGITRVLQDVEISKNNSRLYKDIKNFVDEDLTPTRNDLQIPDKFKPYLTARIDVQLTTEGDFQILSVSDNRANLSKPSWLQGKGIGYLISSIEGNLKFVAKADVDGQVQLFLRGRYISDPENTSKRIPYWIDYTKLTINEEVVFDKLTPAWHDKPYIHNIDIKAGEEITVQVEWLPHGRGDFEKIYNIPTIPDKFKPYLTARIDIQLITDGDFQILSVSDNRASLFKPGWLQGKGVGYLISSFEGNLEFVAKATGDGQIRLWLMGLDVRRPEDNTKRIPYWIDYNKLTVNDQVIFDKLTPVWHDKPYSYRMDVKAGDEIKVSVEWLPHRSDT